MDKNKIKSFAVWARRNLISAVSERANRIGISENNIEKATGVQGGFKLEGKDEIFKLSKEHREALVEQIREKGFEQVMEEVAYTWFNRFMGLRYMEVNDYLPTGVRVLSSEVEGKTEPDVLTRVSEVIDELNLDAEYIYELLDSGKTEDREEAYKHILVRQCNELGKIIPQMFEKISDYTELLLPDNLLEEGSVIRKMVEDIEEEDWKEEVEIIGWMYQYYISEKKDEVFAALKKNVKITKENIPAATQLFTPKWIVKYMVENSLGRLWLEKLSVDSGQWAVVSEELKKKWKYYLEEAEQEPEVEEELRKIREEHSKLKPEDIKVLDPCMGSGHILVYAFDVLYEIYKTAGYSEREIPRIILKNNLYGLDIDDRAAQLAYFALIMKARQYNRRLFREIEREGLELNLCSIQESNVISEQFEEITNYFCNGNDEVAESEKLREDFEYLIEVFTDAKEYGSILEVKEISFEALRQRLRETEEEQNFMFGDYRKILLDRLPVLIKQAEIMSRKYEVCVTNPPYMGIKQGINKNIYKYLNEHFKDSKSDLYSVFIERCIKFLNKNFYVSMISQQTWMFLNSYKQLRIKVLDKITILNLLHLGPRAFPEISGEVVQTAAYTLLNRNLDDFYGVYDRLLDYGSEEKEHEFILGNNRYCSANQEVFKSIEDNPIIYWGSKETLNTFNNEEVLRDRFKLINGPDSKGNNDNYFRHWYEIDNIGISFKGELKCKRWFPLNKGANKKWYGNNIYVSHKDFAGMNSEFMKPGISWLDLSSTFSCRYIPNGFTFNNHGKMCIGNLDELKFLLGYLNSKVAEMFVHLFTVKTKYEVGYVKKIPFKLSNNYKIVNELVNENIYISQRDWDSFETSWDFKIHPLLKLLDKGEQYKLESVFRVWETECEEAFNQLKSNEEELNRIFIDIYGLQDELTPEVEDKDITIRKADRERDIKSLISYSVGCMFGRYSLDEEGLIFAGYNKKCENFNKINDEDKCEFIWNCPKAEWDYNFDYSRYKSFIPDRDNVLPITEDEYFEDDIVSRFIDFIKTVYGEETLEDNLDFIADSIGRKSSETSRQAIRRYFIKDFYKDHLKVYQKRPIYWMFDSGKNDGFKALVYMHRYNEQTVARVRTDYLHTLQRKYEAEIQRQQLIVDSEEFTAKDRNAAKKRIDRIVKQMEECREYDQVVAHLANEKISIDLDDGVKVNYAKFQGVKVINSKGKEVKMDLLAKI